MRLTSTDVFYLRERDGDSTTTDNPATPVAFVIDGEVVAAEAFSPPIGDNIFLANPTYSSHVEEIDGKEVEIVTATVGDVSTEMILGELLTSVVLSSPLAIRISRETSRAVNAGWSHDDRGFYIMQTVDGVTRRLNGMGEVVE